MVIGFPLLLVLAHLGINLLSRYFDHQTQILTSAVTLGASSGMHINYFIPRSSNNVAGIAQRITSVITPMHVCKTRGRKPVHNQGALRSEAKFLRNIQLLSDL